MYKELDTKELKLYNSKIFELLIDIYTISFGISKNAASIICSEKVIALEQYIENGSAIVIGCIQDNNLIGFAWLYLHEYFGEKRLHINQIVVDQKYRAKGIGKNLLHEAEKKATMIGVLTMDLFVSELNVDALKLYDSLGFTTERRYMKKKLKENEIDFSNNY